MMKHRYGLPILERVEVLRDVAPMCKDLAGGGAIVLDLPDVADDEAREALVPLLNLAQRGTLAKVRPNQVLYRNLRSTLEGISHRSGENTHPLEDGKLHQSELASNLERVEVHGDALHCRARGEWA